MVAFPSHEREAFNGLALVIIRSQKGVKGTIKVTAKSNRLKETQISLQSI
jgi:beta-galactosidase